MIKKIQRLVVHAVADSRKFYYSRVEEFAKRKKKLEILELGSGPLVKGDYYYSAKSLFHESNKFLQSDIDPEFGHKIVDATTMKYRSKFDVILCLNVLEHIYDYQTAVDNMTKALKKGGTLIIALPMFYPLHDEPHDYWRFTEHNLRRMLGEKFTIKKLDHTGRREFAFGYYVEAKKK